MTDLADLTARMQASGALTADDVLTLRRTMWPDGVIDAAEADTIFALNDAATAPSSEWTEFFLEAISEHVVRQQAPRGYVDEAKADWLLARIAADGQVDTRTELELLVCVLEKATNAPARLKAEALATIERLVLADKCVSTAEVAILRRVIFAQAGEDATKVSRDEADALFRIKDATLGGANDPAWQTLFVQGIGNHLMAHQSYRALERAEAADLERFMDDHRPSVGGFLRRMLGADPRDGWRAVTADGTPADHDAAVAADRAIAPEERHWAEAAIAADGVLDPLEQALIDFVKAESGTTLSTETSRA